MNKKEFINILNIKINVPKNKIETILDNAQELLLDMVSKGQKLNIKGFGKFYIKEKCERKYYDIRLNKICIVPPKKVIVFKCNKNLI